MQKLESTVNMRFLTAPDLHILILKVAAHTVV